VPFILFSGPKKASIATKAWKPETGLPTFLNHPNHKSEIIILKS
jgi:hypothetical protein